MHQVWQITPIKNIKILLYSNGFVEKCSLKSTWQFDDKFGEHYCNFWIWSRDRYAANIKDNNSWNILITDQWGI